MTWSFTPETRRRLLVGVGILALGFAVLRLGAHPPTQHGMVESPSKLHPLRTVATQKKVLALTFDISWGTVMPPKVLAILEQDHVQATFFLSGPWSQNNPEIVKRIVADGFEVESHGQAHVNFSGLSSSGVEKNIAAADTILRSYGAKPTFIRPPNGDYNQQALRVAKTLGYTIVIWGTDSLDWMNPGVANIESRVVSRAHPGDIILMHASDTCKQTDQALPTIISSLRAKGYTFLTLKGLLAQADQKALPLPPPAGA